MINESYSAARLADRLEIQDRIHQYSRGVDRKDWALVESVYHQDALDRHGVYDGSISGFIDFLKKRHQTVLLSVHSNCNILIDFIGIDDALVETYCIAWQALSPLNADMRAAVPVEPGDSVAPLEMMMLCRYVDHFTRRAGSWKIQERAVAYETSTKILPEATGPDMRHVMQHGQRDQTDVLWVMRERILLSHTPS